MSEPTAAIKNLREHQQQLDIDGIFVGVSRQALEEVLAFVAAALLEGAKLGAREMRDACVKFASKNYRGTYGGHPDHGDQYLYDLPIHETIVHSITKEFDPGLIAAQALEGEKGTNDVS